MKSSNKKFFSKNKKDSSSEGTDSEENLQKETETQKPSI